MPIKLATSDTNVTECQLQQTMQENLKDGVILLQTGF